MKKGKIVAMIGVVISLLPLFFIITCIGIVIEPFNQYDKETNTYHEYQLYKSESEYILENGVQLDPTLLAACVLTNENYQEPSLCLDGNFINDEKDNIMEGSFYQYFDEIMDKSGYRVFSGIIPDTEYTNESLRMPISGDYAVTEYYGFRNNPVEGGIEFHNAIDLVPSGLFADKKLYAMHNGKVIVNSYDETRGNYIVIETDNILQYPEPECTEIPIHEDGIDTGESELVCVWEVEPSLQHNVTLRTWYLHMEDASNIAENDYVIAGKTVGKIGATGQVTGPHLHLAIEVSVDGGDYKFINPNMIIRLTE